MAPIPLKTVFCLPTGATDGDALLWDVSTGKYVTRPIGTDDIVNESNCAGGTTLTEVLDNLCTLVEGAASIITDLLIESVTYAPARVIGGNQVTMTIVLRNQSVIDVTNVTLTHLLPPEMIFISADQGGTHVTQLVTWLGLTIPAVIPGQTTGGTLTLKVTSSTGSVLTDTSVTNKTSVTSISEGGPLRTLTTLLTLTPATDHDITIEASTFLATTETSDFESDDVLTVKIKLKNFGDASAQDVEVEDAIDATKFDLATFSSPNGGELVDTGGGVFVVRWDIGDDINLAPVSGSPPSETEAELSWSMNFEGLDIFTSQATITHTVTVTAIATTAPVPAIFTTYQCTITPETLPTLVVSNDIILIGGLAYTGQQVVVGNVLRFRYRVVNNSSTTPVIVDFTAKLSEHFGLAATFTTVPDNNSVAMGERTIQWISIAIGPSAVFDITFDVVIELEASESAKASNDLVVILTSVQPEVIHQSDVDISIAAFHADPSVTVSKAIASVGPDPNNLVAFTPGMKIFVNDYVRINLELVNTGGLALNVNVLDELDVGYTSGNFKHTESAGVVFENVAGDFFMRILTDIDEGPQSTKVFFYTLQLLDSIAFGNTVEVKSFKGFDGTTFIGNTDTLAFTVEDVPDAVTGWIS